MTESAPNWDGGQGLTWSGKWHVIYGPMEADASPLSTHITHARALCGAYVYTRDHVPRYVGRLQAIAAGRVQAPVCKKCERAARSNTEVMA